VLRRLSEAEKGGGVQGVNNQKHTQKLLESGIQTFPKHVFKNFLSPGYKISPKAYGGWLRGSFATPVKKGNARMLHFQYIFDIYE
jgi:hypothetical protein